MNPTQSTVIIRGLAVRAHVGVGALERRAPQTVVVDVEIQLRDPSIARDHMSASVNYAAVVRCIEETAIMERVVLLETLAEHIASHILEDERVADVTITITKPRKIPNCDAVGVRRTFQNDGVHHGDT
ncbi:MAG: dihydroneopterin aldolase [bacterium]|nr:dihydroneopterin aldolase [bacterium]